MNGAGSITERSEGKIPRGGGDRHVALPPQIRLGDPSIYEYSIVGVAATAPVVVAEGRRGVLKTMRSLPAGTFGARHDDRRVSPCPKHRAFSGSELRRRNNVRRAARSDVLIHRASLLIVIDPHRPFIGLFLRTRAAALYCYYYY